MSSRDKAVYDKKIQIMHKGPCSSPRLGTGADACPCPQHCPLHGRCCDCIAHHKEERLEQKDGIKGACGWMPNCLKYFDERNGIGCKPNPKKGTVIFRPEEIDWENLDRENFDFSVFDTGDQDVSKMDFS